ncbi:PREDICTED: probable 3',5'-cyclic phosphodiesterase pde-5 [Acropora digitifera]|uniref:probable 3',5'-cyclic phosphodiesterase pde-5 n=1 Tax=Acropora digitifera TaxID=70779 RepID=UPI000779FFA3|nr:PREDICTED: probable 3',5'-cyclic phosphodiesterase pde-5 [Acropora digitifera]
MSSPSRQVGNRRLPPLPSGSRQSPSNIRVSSGNGYDASAASVKASKGHALHRSQNNHSGHISHIDLNANFGDGPFRPALGQGKALPGNAQDVDEESVRNYLRASPSFLEDYVMKYVDQERLERWLIRKTRKLKNKGSKKNVNSVEHENNKQSDPHRPSLSKWKFCVHSDKKKMLEELTNDIHQSPNKQKVLMELANCIASACHADSFTLYLVDATGKALYIYNPNIPEGRTSSNINIETGTTIAAYVAHTQRPLRTNEVLGDERFPGGIGLEDSTAQSVLCQPIVQSNGELIGVIELCRRLGHEAFGEEDDEVVNSYLVWGGISLYYAEMFQNMQRHRKLTEFLLNVTRSIFQDIVSMDTVIMKIMNYAQTLVDADRTSLFLVDNRTSELYARIFDIGGSLEDSRSSNLQKEIRFPKSKGVAGHVATTGETLNITDAYHDERFNRQIDIQTGYTTNTLLCMPIFIRGNIIGVVQMVNKKSGVFTASDEKSFQTFAIYCGLALHHAKLYDKIRRSEQKHRVALEVLSYHSKCSDYEYKSITEIEVMDPYPNLETYAFDSYALSSQGLFLMPSLVIQMTKNLFSLQRFGLDELRRFVLTVRKNYRDVPYHNWTHAFAVAHSMYLVIRSGNNRFTALEALAMFFASLCHDLDHRGRTNSWMKNEQTPLAAVYSTSTMEHHHFNQTITILQPWEIQLEIVKVIYQEFYAEGDLEKAQGKTPIAMKDRNTAHELPAHQVGFLVGICLPCYELLQKCIPETKPLVDGSQSNLQKWSRMAQHNRAALDAMNNKNSDESGKKGAKESGKDNANKSDKKDDDSEEKQDPEEKKSENEQKESIKEEEKHVDEEEKEKTENSIENSEADKDKLWHCERKLLRAICMTACDLSACTKPWEIQLEIVKVIYQEFYAEGDLEKAQGKTPIAMKDRNTAHELPAHQVGFLVGICLPCYELLQKCIPETKPLVDGSQSNLQKWSRMAQHNRAALDAMNNKNSDESGKKGAKESGKDNANKSDKKDDDSEEKQDPEEKKSENEQKESIKEEEKQVDEEEKEKTENSIENSEADKDKASD